MRRLERAVELSPKSSTAYLELGIALAYRATEGMPAEEKEALLIRAKGKVFDAVKLQGGHDFKTLHSLGWIWDEEGRYNVAADFYRKARKMYQEKTGKVSRSVEASITYNLCCSLVKGASCEEALDELGTVIDHVWRHAAKEPAFERLRSSQTYRPRFLKLIEQGKSAASS